MPSESSSASLQHDQDCSNYSVESERSVTSPVQQSLNDSVFAPSVSPTSSSPILPLPGSVHSGTTNASNNLKQEINAIPDVDSPTAVSAFVSDERNDGESDDLPKDEDLQTDSTFHCDQQSTSNVEDGTSEDEGHYDFVENDEVASTVQICVNELQYQDSNQVLQNLTTTKNLDKDEHSVPSSVPPAESDSFLEKSALSQQSPLTESIFKALGMQDSNQKDQSGDIEKTEKIESTEESEINEVKHDSSATYLHTTDEDDNGVAYDLDDSDFISYEVGTILGLKYRPI